MTNYEKSRAEIEAMPGDLVVATKAQMFHLLTKAEIGERAERALGSIALIGNLGASAIRMAS